MSATEPRELDRASERGREEDTHDVLGTVRDVEEALLVDEAEVAPARGPSVSTSLPFSSARKRAKEHARSEPALVVERLARRLLVAPVASRDVGPVDADLADLAGFERRRGRDGHGRVGRDDLEVDGGRGEAARGGACGGEGRASGGARERREGKRGRTREVVVAGEGGRDRVDLCEACRRDAVSERNRKRRSERERERTHRSTRTPGSSARSAACAAPPQAASSSARRRRSSASRA